MSPGRTATARSSIQLQDRGEVAPVDRAALRRLAAAVVRTLGLGPVELSLVCVDDPEMRALNRAHLGRDRTTDVLSFPLAEVGTGAGPRVLGDVVLSIPTIQRRAGTRGRAADRELARCLVHGVLHLLGHDHVGSAARRREMRRLEAELLEGLRRAGLVGRDAPPLTR